MVFFCHILTAIVTDYLIKDAKTEIEELSAEITSLEVRDGNEWKIGNSCSSQQLIDTISTLKEYIYP